MSKKSNSLPRIPRSNSKVEMRARNTSDSSSSSYVDKLLDLTTCPICSNTLEEPRFLPCHHSFCTKCIQRLMHSAKDEFLCPIDRKSIKVPIHGICSFEVDTRTIELDRIRNDLSFLESQGECDSTVAKIDVSLEWLSKGIKDVEHSSAMAQQTVHSMFEKVYKELKHKEEELANEIQQKCVHHLAYMEFEKYRLIEIKMQEKTTCSEQNEGKGSLTESDAPRLSLVSCDIGHQHIEFLPCENKVKQLGKYLEDLGNVSWEFGLNIKLDRDLCKLGEYPYGIDIIGANKKLLSCTLSAPAGISKGLRNRILVACREKNKLIIFDNSFNVEKIIEGEGKFRSIAAVATFDDRIYVADSVGCQLLLISSDGEVIKCFGRQGNGTMDLNRPCGVTVNSKGHVLVADSFNHRIQILSSNLQKCKKSINSIGNKDDILTTFSHPSGITVDKEDNIYFCDTSNNRVVILTKEGTFMQDIHSASLRDPRCVAVTSDDKILITSREKSSLMICDSKDGKELLNISGISNNKGEDVKFKEIHGVVVDGTDKIWVTDVGCNSVFMF